MDFNAAYNRVNWTALYVGKGGTRQIRGGGTILNWLVQSPAYANDIDIKERRKRDVEQCLVAIGEADKQIGLDINGNKTK